MSADRTRTAILDAAEAEFAECGFDGASMRAIARRAGVHQPLIHYHFDTKEALFEAVFDRRAGGINEARRARLADLFNAAAPHAPALEAVIDALLRPTLELGYHGGEGGQHYARLVVATASGTDARSIRLIAEHYNPIAERFVDALTRVLPGLSREEAAWGYLYTISVGLPLMARTGRVRQLSTTARDDSINELLARAVRFVSAGLRSLAQFGAADQQPGRSAAAE